jgi:hypothetical protein
MGASLLCEKGSTGVLPSSCVNDCTALSYKSQTASPFVCIPFRTIKVGSIKISQFYLNAYSDVSDFQAFSGLSSSTQVESTGEYSFSTGLIDLGRIDSFYKLEIRLKYISGP